MKKIIYLSIITTILGIVCNDALAAKSPVTPQEFRKIKEVQKIQNAEVSALAANFGRMSLESKQSTQSLKDELLETKSSWWGKKDVPSVEAVIVLNPLLKQDYWGSKAKEIEGIKILISKLDELLDIETGCSSEKIEAFLKDYVNHRQVVYHDSPTNETDTSFIYFIEQARKQTDSRLTKEGWWHLAIESYISNVNETLEDGLKNITLTTNVESFGNIAGYTVIDILQGAVKNSQDLNGDQCSLMRWLIQKGCEAHKNVREKMNSIKAAQEAEKK